MNTQDEDILTSIAAQRLLIDQKLAELTREEFINFHGEDDNDDAEVGDTLSPLPLDVTTSSSSSVTPTTTTTTTFPFKRGVVVRKRRGRAQVLHALSQARGAVLASRSLLQSIENRRISFQTSTSSLKFVDHLHELLSDCLHERENIMKEGAGSGRSSGSSGSSGSSSSNGGADSLLLSSSVSTTSGTSSSFGVGGTSASSSDRTPLLIPWSWIHSQRGTSCNEDLTRIDAQLLQIQKDVERDQYVIIFLFFFFNNFNNLLFNEFFSILYSM